MKTLDQTVHANSGTAAAGHHVDAGREPHHLAGGDQDLLGVPTSGEQRTHLVADLPAFDVVADGGDGAAALEPQGVGGTGGGG